MKTVYLVRHAKSSWDSNVSSDFDRPLNERGKRDAPIMGERLLELKAKIDGLISSPAKRARKTAEAFAKVHGFKEKHITFEPKLYEASHQAFYDVIENADKKIDRLAIFGHNPGITDFVNELTETVVDNMPTAAVFAVSAETDDWKNFREAKKKMLFFEYPKKLV